MPPSTTLILAATVPRYGIGLNGGLPWRLAKEMKFFKQVTTAQKNAVVIMGRTTWDSIPPKFRPLPDRTNIVLTSRPMPDAPQDVLVAKSFDEALTKCPEDSTVYVIGGSQVYKTALVHEHTKAVLLTEITCPDGHVECDTFFEGFDQGLWKKQTYERLQDFVGEKVELPGRDVPVEEKGFSFVYTLWEK